jgi:hypothetical protein
LAGGRFRDYLKWLARNETLYFHLACPFVAVDLFVHPVFDSDYSSFFARVFHLFHLCPIVQFCRRFTLGGVMLSQLFRSSFRITVALFSTAV